MANASQSSVINLFAMQNKKVSEYLENITDERLYSNKKYFKKYYISYIIYLMKTLYIYIEHPIIDTMIYANYASDEERHQTPYIPGIYMINYE
jgi:hypothetical protein